MHIEAVTGLRGVLGSSRWYWIMGASGLITLFLVGLAQGTALGIDVSQASQPGLLHEVLHDFRHAAGFPCH